jgi:hypothetical protein
MTGPACIAALNTYHGSIHVSPSEPGPAKKTQQQTPANRMCTGNALRLIPGTAGYGWQISSTPNSSTTHPGKAGRPRRRTPEESAFAYIAPKCVRSQDAYRVYYEQEAEQFSRNKKEKGSVPFVPPSGRDINDDTRWENLPMNDQERLAFAWGAAHTANPYGVAAIINHGGSLATAVAYALETVEPTEGIEAWFNQRPIWPVIGNDKVVTCHQIKAVPLPTSLKRSMDEAEKSILPQAMNEVTVQENHLSQVVRIKMRTYSKKKGPEIPTHARASGPV